MMLNSADGPKYGSIIIYYWISTFLIIGYMLDASHLLIALQDEINIPGAAFDLEALLGRINLPYLLACLALLLRLNVGLSDLAYAGVLFHLSDQVIATRAADTLSATILAGFLLCLALSFFTQNSARRKKSPYGGLFTRSGRRPYGSLFLKSPDRWDIS